MRSAPLLRLLVLVPFWACANGDGPIETRAGSLAVEVATVGHSQDADGYQVRVNGSEAGHLALDDSLFLFDLDPGAYTVELTGIAGNCHSPAVQQMVEFAAGDRATAQFAVGCDSVLSGVILFTRIIPGAPGIPGTSEIFQVRPDGSALAPLTPGSRATASPDRRQVVFNRTSPVSSIYRMNVDGTGLVDLTPGTPEDQCPIWSPDGRSIAFSSKRSGEWQLYLMRPDGTDQSRLTFSDRQEACGASWSPDASRLVFERSLPDYSGSEVFIINVDGTGEQKLSTEPADGAPAWAPDGERVVFNSARSGTNQLWVMQADGQSPRNLTRAEEFFHGAAVWSPDGEEIVFERSGVDPAGSLYKMRPDGTSITPLTSGSASFDVPSQWLP